MNEAVEIAPDNVPAPGPGAMLALERSGKGFSVADIAAQLRYSPKQIEALEGDDYSRLPGTTFVRGMIRGYAKILGTPATPFDVNMSVNIITTCCCHERSTPAACATKIEASAR